MDRCTAFRSSADGRVQRMSRHRDARSPVMTDPIAGTARMSRRSRERAWPPARTERSGSHALSLTEIHAMLQNLKLIVALSLVAFAAPLAAQDMSDGTMSMSSNGDVVVGGKEMSRGKDIIDNAVNSADHTTLVAAVKAADLVGTLKGKGPF